MFESQWPESARKRAREDDEHEGINAGISSMGFTEHRNVGTHLSALHTYVDSLIANLYPQKRLQSLPLRTSPTHRRRTDRPGFPGQMLPPTIIPSDSGSENWSSTMDPSQQPASSRSMDVDRDMDMMADDGGVPQNSTPTPSQSDSSVSGRIPTPIHCSFAAQVRSSWGSANQAAHLANQSAHATPEHGTSYIQQRHQDFPPTEDSIPRSVEAAEWSMVRDRRLPSPISECGGEDAPNTPGMVLDSTSPVMTSLQRPYLPHLPHSINPAAMLLHPNIRTPPRASDGDTDTGMTDADATTPTSAPASPSPRGKFGHCRSKHTVNTWTLQPGMKKSFSIGYRADCEKCRMKIPGHFNHIIVS